MSDAVLASRLHDLVDLGVLRTEQYSERPPRFEYRLTECGIDFWKTAIGVWEWERRWSHRINGRLPEFVHLVGGHQATIDFGCGGCSTSAERLRLDADSHRQLRMGQPVVPRRRRRDRGHHACGVPRRTHPRVVLQPMRQRTRAVNDHVQHLTIVGPSSGHKDQETRESYTLVNVRSLCFHSAIFERARRGQTRSGRSARQAVVNPSRAWLIRRGQARLVDSRTTKLRAIHFAAHGHARSSLERLAGGVCRRSCRLAEQTAWQRIHSDPQLGVV